MDYLTNVIDTTSCMLNVVIGFVRLIGLQKKDEFLIHP